mmetsp:Transcript_18589/g.27570  ORF Transcript_18589/g.27570 Transcript_18589/m.27570 type:complete len:502 (+) Transcript_18589:38-1543(+)
MLLLSRYSLCVIRSVFVSATSLSKMSMTTSTPGKNAISYNFWRGHPNDDLLPTKEMQEILQKMASPTNQDRLKDSLQYLSSDRGDPVLLKEISSFLLRRTLEDEVPQYEPGNWAITNDEWSVPEELDMFLTHGVSHGLDMLCTTQTTPGDIVLIERPSYFLAAGIFRSHGLKIQSLPMKLDPTGERHAVGGALMVDVEALERGLHDGSIGVPRMIYIIPTNQNPTGNTMNIANRWKLCQLAREFGILVAADEVYHLLDWRDDSRPARFSVLDHMLSKQYESSKTNSNFSVNKKGQFGCSVSVSSFTKIFTPGVRCGWIEGPKEIIDSIVDLGYIQSQGGCAPFIGNLLRTALENGLQDEILDKLNESYKDRCKILCSILESEPGIRICYRPMGGYFMWVEFLDLTTAEKKIDNNVIEDSPVSTFAKFCLDHGLKFMPGVKCDSVLDCFEQSQQPKELCETSARLCFADMDAGDVADGAKLLVHLYRKYKSETFGRTINKKI